MNRKDLDALNELYLSVYSDPEQLNEIGVNFGGQKAVDKVKSDMAAERQSNSRLDAMRAQRFGGVSPIVKAAKGGVQGTLDKTSGKWTATKPITKPAPGAKTTPAATTPTVTPTTSTSRPAASTSSGTPKVAPTRPATPAGPAKPAIGTTPGGTKFERRTPTSSELRAAQAARAEGKGEEGAVKAGVEQGKADNIVKSGAVAALKPAAPTPSPAPARNGFGASTAPMAAKSSVSSATAPVNTINNKKPITQMSSYEWPSAKTIREIAGAYSSIYEAKKKVDQDQDGDNDFADVIIARMIASGMTKAQAIAMVKDKSYNEEVELWVNDLLEEGYDLSEYTWEDMFEIYLDEATRMRKELGKEGEIATRQELARRSNAYQRSGSVDRTIAAAERGAKNPYVVRGKNETEAEHNKRKQAKSQTLTRLASNRRGSVRDKPRAGLRGYAAKVEGSDRDLQSARSSAMAAGTLTPREQKMLNKEAYEAYEFVASYLLENNFASTVDDANVIINNMSENWFNQIIEG